jgi:hypothetical protein
VLSYFVFGAHRPLPAYLLSEMRIHSVLHSALNAVLYSVLCRATMS